MTMRTKSHFCFGTLKTKSIKHPILMALGVCLLVTMGCSPETKPEAQAQPETQPETQAKENPQAVANFEAGIAAYQANDLPLAYNEFLAAAREGHADSQFNLALMYEQGIGTAKDEKEAVVWYGKSAAQGNAAAQFNLGVLYENGRGTEIDFAKANAWYRKASVQGDALAIGNLGMLYVRGDGVKENKVAGLALLLISATQDPSPENFAKRNITSTRGLTPEMVAEAQTLSGELSSAKSLLVPLDQYLMKAKNSTEKK
jgi:TPR repeat protein